MKSSPYKRNSTAKKNGRDKIAEQINAGMVEFQQLAGEAVAAYGKALRSYVSLGRELARARSAVRRTDWQRWIKANCPNVIEMEGGMRHTATSHGQTLFDVDAPNFRPALIATLSKAGILPPAPRRKQWKAIDTDWPKQVSRLQGTFEHLNGGQRALLKKALQKLSQ